MDNHKNNSDTEFMEDKQNECKIRATKSQQIDGCDWRMYKPLLIPEVISWEVACVYLLAGIDCIYSLSPRPLCVTWALKIKVKMIYI